MYEIAIIGISVFLGLLAFIGLVFVLFSNKRFLKWWVERSLELADSISEIADDMD